MATLTLRDDQKVSVKVVGKDRRGNPIADKLEDVPVWSSSDDKVLKVTAHDGGLGADLEAVGPVGTAQAKMVYTHAGASKNAVVDVTIVTGQIDAFDIAQDGPAVDVLPPEVNPTPAPAPGV